METARKGRSDLDETSCGVYCQHPACWQSNQRQEKGFPFRSSEPSLNKRQKSPDDEIGLPVMNVYNLIEDYGDDERDRFPVESKSVTSENLHNLYLTYPRQTDQLSPLLTPASVVHPAKKKTPPKVKVVEVQELFDAEDLENSWDETFITKQCYVWVPKKREDTDEKTVKDTDNLVKSGTIPTKDVTEELVPEIFEREREETRLKRLATRCTSPRYGRGHYSVKSSYSNRMPFDTDGINNLLSLPSDVLMQVLDHLRDSDLMSKDRINDVIHDFQPPLIRDETGLSLGTTEVLQQKKLPLLQDKKRNIRESHLMETRPVFQLDNSFVLDKVTSINTPVQETEPNTTRSNDQLSIQGFSKYKKPLPAIKRLQRGSGKEKKKKVSSISLGLPELPLGIKHTRPFTYKKSDTMDLSIGPMPTPPTSIRSISSIASEHGTTLNVNFTTPTENTSRKHEIDVRFPEIRMSPEPSELPSVPYSTPAVDHAVDQDRSFISIKPSSGNIVSPVNRVMVPVNSPTNSESGLKTIPEVSARSDAPVVSKDNDVKLDQDEVNQQSTYSSPDPWPQVTDADFTTPVEDKRAAQQTSVGSKSRPELSSQESEHERIARKVMDEGAKGISPAPPPPSPEGRESDRTQSATKAASRQSATMDTLLEDEEDLVRGNEEEIVQDNEAVTTTVSEIVPDPNSLQKEKSFHTFVNVDIPAKVTSTEDQRPKLERSTHSFVTTDIPASREKTSDISASREKTSGVSKEDVDVGGTTAAAGGDPLDSTDEPSPEEHPHKSCEDQQELEVLENPEPLKEDSELVNENAGTPT